MRSAERAAAAGDSQARGVVAALSTLSTQLSAAQVGITVTNLLIGYMAEPSIARLVDAPLASVGFSEDAADGLALVIALVLATGVTMVFGELVPKNLAIARPLATARAVQGFQRGFTRSTAIVVRALERDRERDPAAAGHRAAGGAGLGPLAGGAGVARAALRATGHA